jgi:elongation factor G
MCFVNKMDRMGANFYRAVDMMKKNLGAKVAILQLPIGAEAEFAGVIDLVEMNAIVWRDEELGAKFDVIPLAECDRVSDEIKQQAKEYREQLVELAVEEVRATTSYPIPACLPAGGGLGVVRVFVERHKQYHKMGTGWLVLLAEG